jgi:hypothetical protein
LLKYLSSSLVFLNNQAIVLLARSASSVDQSRI